MEEKGVSPIVAIVIVIVIAAIGVGSYFILKSGERAKAEMPTHLIGEEWTYRVTDDNAYTFHYEVIAEETVDNKDCYVIELLSTPPYLGGLGGLLSGENTWVEKETGLPVKKQISGEYIETPFTKTLTFVYHSVEDVWPIEVGKEVTATMTVIENSSLSGTRSTTKTVTLKVEKRENITVPAGTFTCFKVDSYEYGYKTATSWYSDNAKHYVKRIDYTTGETHELVSYLIQ